MSPDYFITKIAKESFLNIGKDEKAELLKIYNHENLLLSVALSIFLIAFHFLNLTPTFNYCFLVLCGYRFVSRSVEIVISFCKDVVRRKIDASSNLDWKDRIILAFLSIVEILFLSFGLYFALEGGDLANAALNAICLIISSPSSMSDWRMIDTIKLFENITCFALLGIVITSYIGNKNEEKTSTPN